LRPTNSIAARSNGRCRAAADPAAVFVARSAFVPIYQRGLERLHMPFVSYRAGAFVVYQPSRRTSVERALAAGRAG